MKSFRLIALSALVTVGSLSTMVYTSCTKDECKDVACLHGGTCTGGTCTCPAGYTGATCGTRSFIGQWSGTDVCSPSAPGGTIKITLAPVSTGDSSKVLIDNAAGFLGTFTGTLSTNAETITYSNQVVSNSGTGITYYDTLSGTMTLTTSTSFNHNYTDRAGITYTCSGTYSKL